MATLIGQKLGQYEITSLLGKGGMATVYRARQTSMDRDVAIKVIKPDLAETADFVARFQREARIIASLGHANILKVFDYGQHGDLVYLVMELLPGGNLADLIHQGPLPLDKVSRFLDQIAAALDYAHSKGIIHRDLKPQNVLLDETGTTHLSDFGLAKILSETTVLTQTGVAMGTPAYMPPEQWQGEPLDARADIYALGVMLFEMLAGRLPFVADTPYGLMHQHVNTLPPAISSLRGDVPPTVEAVIRKALAKEPGERYQSSGALAEAFNTALARASNGTRTDSGLMTEIGPISGQFVEVNSPIAQPIETSQPATHSRARTLWVGLFVLITATSIAGLIWLPGKNSPPTATSGSPAVAQQPTTAQASASASATLDFVAAAQTFDSQSTAAVKATSLEQTRSVAVGQTATATLWTPTLFITVSFQAFLTKRADTQAAQDTSNQTTTATSWTKSPMPSQTATFTLTFTPTNTPTPTPTATFTLTNTPVSTATPVPPTRTSTSTLLPTATEFPTVTANNQWKPQYQDFNGVTMVLVPPGCFMMGSTAIPDAQPVTKICFNRPFWIDKTDVTQAQFKRLGGSSSFAPQFKGDNRPVERIDWLSARGFCEHQRYARLPTEAEWEYAARGPDNLVYPWGNTFDPNNAIYIDNSSNQTADVGSKPNGVSWVGALDMAGNVWQWTSSLYNPYPYKADDGREIFYGYKPNMPHGLARGGAWDGNPSVLRSAYRASFTSGGGLSYNGFRCAHSY